MSDSRPIFNDDEDDVTREIEANEERDVDTRDDRSIESTLEKAIRPVTDALGRDSLNAKQRAARRRANDGEQSSS